MTIGNRIESLRKKKNMTQQEFCRFVCVSQAYLSMVEHDKVNPSKAVIRLISILFDVNEDWLINGSSKD